MSTQTISRFPAADEPSGESLLHYQARCEMVPDTSDLTTAAEQWLDKRWGFGTVEYDRARRANGETRVKALELFDLTQWKQALRALWAVTYGQVSKNVSELIELCYYAKRMGEAGRAVAAFNLAGPTLGYVDSQVVKAAEDLTSAYCPNPPAATLKRIAALAGLVADNGVYEYAQGSYPGHNRVRDKTVLEAVLASGFARFDKPAVKDVLQYWAGLANQRGEKQSLPEDLTYDSILHWAKSEIHASATEEGSNRPIAFVNNDQGCSIQLEWRGTFTPKRSVFVHVAFDNDVMDITEVDVQWESGTQKPSRFLSIEDLLTLPGCFDFIVNPNSMSEE